MLKEVNNKNRINIAKEFLKKQIFDCTILFVTLCLVFYFVKIAGFDSFDLLIVLFICFLILSALFYYSTLAVKNPLTKTVEDNFEKTIADIDFAQTTNNNQKEKNSLSVNKINDVQKIIEDLEEYSNKMNQITGLTKEKTDNSLDFTNSEYNAVKTNIEKMFSIRHKIQTIAELILELSDFVQSISSTVGLVEDIAEQTNLLALNAAVEAARAGEHGKGFAVVASEIRKLADESKQATAKIISLINDIQQTANSTVLATEEGTKEIESGLELAQTISENIERMISAMSEISLNMQEIAASTLQITQGTRKTDDYIKEIYKITKESDDTIKENETFYKKLETTSLGLKNSIT